MNDEEYKQSIIEKLEEIPASAFLFWEWLDEWIENNRDSLLNETDESLNNEELY